MKVSTLGYVLSADRQRVLMLRHRGGWTRRKRHPWFNGIGGKLDPHEDICECMVREMREETGLECERMELAGTILWPEVGPPRHRDWFGFLFRITDWSGELRESGPEGQLSWVPVDEVLSSTLPMWSGDRLFLPLVFGGLGQFHGNMRYASDDVVSWSYTMLRVEGSSVAWSRSAPS